MSFRGDASSVRFPTQRYIRNLIDQGHESVLEHACWTLLIDRVSRAFTHQLVRHRIGFSFSQLSQQYHDESDSEFVSPVELSDRPELQMMWRKSVLTARDSYRELLSQLMKNGLPNDRETLRRFRSTARSLLPNATETAVAVTANARALRHLFATRGAVVGDVEMRQVAYGIFLKVQSDAPALFSDFEAGISAIDKNPIVQPKKRRRKIKLVKDAKPKRTRSARRRAR
jgi:thymidylate synthase (FAD)